MRCFLDTRFFYKNIKLRGSLQTFLIPLNVLSISLAFELLKPYVLIYFFTICIIVDYCEDPLVAVYVRIDGAVLEEDAHLVLVKSRFC